MSRMRAATSIRTPWPGPLGIDPGGVLGQATLSKSPAEERRSKVDRQGCTAFCESGSGTWRAVEKFLAVRQEAVLQLWIQKETPTGGLTGMSCTGGLFTG